MWQVIIHSVFILSALALIDRMSFHKIAPQEVLDGVPVAHPGARRGLDDIEGPLELTPTARER